MLKAVPNKNAGFIILLTSIFTFFFFGEIRNLTTFTRLMDYNNGFSLSFFFNLFLSFLWIGAQFPQEKFLSYGRILTLDYYFLLMCILFHRFENSQKMKTLRLSPSSTIIYLWKVHQRRFSFSLEMKAFLLLEFLSTVNGFTLDLSLTNGWRAQTLLLTAFL